jgi:hypothetical protein
VAVIRSFLNSGWQLSQSSNRTATWPRDAGHATAAYITLSNPALTAAMATRMLTSWLVCPPSDNERLEAIRAHADGTMRYYATAFLRETDENRDLMQAYMGITANILALLDGDALDDRSMMREREEIIQQYIEQARSDPYEPGNCSFCGERPVAAWFEGPTFRTFVRSSADVRAEEAWLACAVCLALVEANDREGLVERGVERLRRSDREQGRQRSPREEVGLQQATRDHQEKEFWRPRQG